MLSLMFVMSIILSSCSKQQPVVHVGFSDADKTKVLSDIESHAGMILPRNVIVLEAEEGDPRTPGDFRWTIYSKVPNRIGMPPLHDQNGAYYITNRTYDATELLKVFCKVNITNATVCLNSHWDTNKYHFQAFVVRTPDGDYFHLDQFPQL
jgi:hypothetical protein